MLFIEGKVDIFLSGPKNTVEEVCKRTLRMLIPECDQSNAPLEPPQTMAFKTNTATLYHYFSNSLIIHKENSKEINV